MPARARSMVVVVVLSGVLAACAGGDRGDAGAGESAAGATPTADAPAAEGPADFTAADLDAYERGIAREMELVRTARAAYDTASTPDSRGRLMSAQWESATIEGGAQAAGLDAQRYKAIRDAVHATMRTLDYQGRIDGPTSYDTSRADQAMRERLARDAYSDLPPTAAAALRAREARIATLWGDYVLLTAVGG